MSLYDILKAAKLGAAPDVLTKLRAQIAPFAKGSNTEVKELEDTPPLSFSANGEPLIDWSIDGAAGGVGNKTSNYFNTSQTVQDGYYNNSGQLVTDGSGAGHSEKFAIGDTKTFTITGLWSGAPNFAVNQWDSSQQWLRRSDRQAPTNATTPITFTVGDDAEYLSLQIYTEYDYSKIMLVEGSEAATFEPSGYKIPVTCGGETKTIYLDAPLGASDSISMTDTGISIPTVDGSNTLSVGTTVQPSSVYIKYKE